MTKSTVGIASLKYWVWWHYDKLIGLEKPGKKRARVFVVRRNSTGRNNFQFERIYAPEPERNMGDVPSVNPQDASPVSAEIYSKLR